MTMLIWFERSSGNGNLRQSILAYIPT